MGETDKKKKKYKDEDSSKKRKKSKHDDEENKSKKRHKKESRKKESKKKHRKKQKKSSSSDSDSSSDSSDEERTGSNRMEDQLAQFRRAVHLVRVVCANYRDHRSDLRQLFLQLDGGEGVNISGLADPKLKDHLEQVFRCLSLRQSSSSQVYSVPKSSSKPSGPSLMSTFAPVLAESPDDSLLVPPDDESAKQPSPSMSNQHHTTATAAVAQEEDHPKEMEREVDLEEEVLDEEVLEEEVLEEEEEGDVGTKEASAVAVKGTREGGSEEKEENGVDDVMKEDQEEVEEEEVVVGPAPRRVAGPAMPPQEVLQAAAALTGVYDDEDDADMIGPPPPAIVADDELSSTSDRSKEVERILRVSLDGGDAYDFLGVDPEGDCSKGALKKAYWRISLKVHPDKCDHAEAKQAFDLAFKAHKQLSDPSERAALDEKRTQAKVEVVARRLHAEARQAAEWRRARGEAPEDGDLALLRTAPGEMPGEEGGRESWMTELPPERRAAQPAQVNITAFSARPPQKRGDTSGWTDTPEQARARQAQMYLQSYQDSLRIEAATATLEEKAKEETAAAVDGYNERLRPMSLLEAHQEKKTKGKKSKGGTKKGGGEKVEDAEPEEWVGNHPWKPWDREKDLTIKPKAKSAKELSNVRGSLNDRFGSGGASRSFL